MGTRIVLHPQQNPCHAHFLLDAPLERFCRDAQPLVTFVQFLHDRFLPQTRIPIANGTSADLCLDAFVELHVRSEEAM